jgi:hypothetical protein
MTVLRVPKSTPTTGGSTVSKLRKAEGGGVLNIPLIFAAVSGLGLSKLENVLYFSRVGRCDEEERS